MASAPIVAKVTIYHASTGAAVERWPVDARGMVQSGEYVLTPPGAAASGAAPAWAKNIGVPVTPVSPGLTPLGEPVRSQHSSVTAPGVPVSIPTGHTGTAKGKDRR